MVHNKYARLSQIFINLLLLIECIQETLHIYGSFQRHAKINPRIDCKEDGRDIGLKSFLLGSLDEDDARDYPEINFV